MKKQLRVATSPLSNTIFAGTLLKDGRTWASNKQDVTMDCLLAVAEHVDNFGEPVEIYTMDNAIEYRITVESFKQAKEQSCSTLCHPEEECFITESGKCEAKEE